MRVKIDIDGQSQIFDLDSYGKDVIFFGRSSECDIRLNRPYVSRRHGIFYKQNGKWFIKDAGSLNGIFGENGKIDLQPLEGKIYRIYNEAERNSRIKIIGERVAVSQSQKNEGNYSHNNISSQDNIYQQEMNYQNNSYSQNNVYPQNNMYSQNNAEGNNYSQNDIYSNNVNSVQTGLTNQQTTKTKKKNYIIPIIIVIAALLIATIGFIAIIKHKKSSKDDSDVSSSTDATENDATENDASNKEKDKNLSKYENPADEILKPNIYYKTYSNSISGSDGIHTALHTSYSTMELSEVSAENYPKLAEAFKNYNEAVKADVDRFVNEYKDEALENFDKQGDVFHSYSDNRTIYIHRIDESVVSFTEFYSNDTGGMHGMHGTNGFTYDVKTGNEITFDDVVSDRDAFADYMDEQLDIYDPTVRSGNPGVSEAIHSYFQGEKLNWSLDYEGITIYFPPYSIASYANGEIRLPADFEARPDLFTGKYSSVDNDWGVNGDRIYIDTQSDNSPELIHVDSNYDSNFDDITSFTINVGDESYVYEKYSFGITYEGVIKRSGRYYLYLQTCYEDGATTIAVFDITGGKISYIRDFKSEGRSNYIADYENYPSLNCEHFDDADSSTGGWLYNPNYFFICSYMDFLGSYEYVRPYKVGDDGVPVPLEQQYSTRHGGILKTKREITVDIIDDDHNTTGEKKILPSGTEIKGLSTDNRSYGEYKLEDGTKIRIDAEKKENDHRYYIDGISEDEIFEVLPYAW